MEGEGRKVQLTRVLACRLGGRALPSPRALNDSEANQLYRSTHDTPHHAAGLHSLDALLRLYTLYHTIGAFELSQNFQSATGTAISLFSGSKHASFTRPDTFRG